MLLKVFILEPTVLGKLMVSAFAGKLPACFHTADSGLNFVSYIGVQRLPADCEAASRNFPSKQIIIHD